MKVLLIVAMESELQGFLSKLETEVTLITCTNNVEDRLIVKCRVME